MKCIHHDTPAKGPCFPPNQNGDASFLLVDTDPDSRVPSTPYCVGHLQHLLVFIFSGLCADADIDFFFDEYGMAYIDPETSAAWETESRAYEDWESQRRGGG